MKTRVSYLAALLLTAVACNKIGTVPGGGPESSLPILFRTAVRESVEGSGADTKAVFTPGNFNAAGNEITVHDKFTNALGESNHYIQGAVAEYKASRIPEWDFQGGASYYWTKTGKHDFTAYTSAAADGSSLPEGSVSYNLDTDRLNITDLTSDLTEQFDFMYAHHSRSMSANNPYAEVPLSFSHLFCAVQFNITNITSGATFGIQGLTMSGLSTRADAEITRPADPSSPADVTISPDGSKNDIEARLTTVISITFTESVNIFAEYDSQANSAASGSSTIGSEGFLLLWPQSLRDADGNAAIKVTIALSGYSDKTEISFDLSSPNYWRAGRKYIYNISIQDDKIHFNVEVVDWVTDDVILDER